MPSSLLSTAARSQLQRPSVVIDAAAAPLDDYSIRIVQNISCTISTHTSPYITTDTDSVARILETAGNNSVLETGSVEPLQRTASPVAITPCYEPTETADSSFRDPLPFPVLSSSPDTSSIASTPPQRRDSTISDSMKTGNIIAGIGAHVPPRLSRRTSVGAIISPTSPTTPLSPSSLNNEGASWFSVSDRRSSSGSLSRLSEGRISSNLAVYKPSHMWMADVDAAKCSSPKCKVTFLNLLPFSLPSITRNRHHCRMCGGVFCSACASCKAALIDTRELPWMYIPQGSDMLDTPVTPQPLFSSRFSMSPAPKISNMTSVLASLGIKGDDISSNPLNKRETNQIEPSLSGPLIPPTFSIPRIPATTALAASCLRANKPLVRVERICVGCAEILRKEAGIGRSKNPAVDIARGRKLKEHEELEVRRLASSVFTLPTGEPVVSAPKGNQGESTLPARARQTSISSFATSATGTTESAGSVVITHGKEKVKSTHIRSSSTRSRRASAVASSPPPVATNKTSTIKRSNSLGSQVQAAQVVVGPSFSLRRTTTSMVARTTSLTALAAIPERGLLHTPTHPHPPPSPSAGAANRPNMRRAHSSNEVVGKTAASGAAINENAKDMNTPAAQSIGAASAKDAKDNAKEKSRHVAWLPVSSPVSPSTETDDEDGDVTVTIDIKGKGKERDVTSRMLEVSPKSTIAKRPSPLRMDSTPSTILAATTEILAPAVEVTTPAADLTTSLPGLLPPLEIRASSSMSIRSKERNRAPVKTLYGRPKPGQLSLREVLRQTLGGDDDSESEDEYEYEDVIAASSEGSIYSQTSPSASLSIAIPEKKVDVPSSEFPASPPAAYPAFNPPPYGLLQRKESRLTYHQPPAPASTPITPINQLPNVNGEGPATTPAPPAEQPFVFVEPTYAPVMRGPALPRSAVVALNKARARQYREQAEIEKDRAQRLARANRQGSTGTGFGLPDPFNAHGNNNYVAATGDERRVPVVQGFGQRDLIKPMYAMTFSTF